MALERVAQVIGAKLLFDALKERDPNRELFD
jgi:hypothetical protein